jgi:nucleotide-binding universal stress UspA family protein
MKILLASDGSGASAGAVRVAAALETDRGARVQLLQVLEPLEIHGPPSAHLLVAPDPWFAKRRSELAHERIRGWLSSLGSAASGWPIRVETGPVPVTIVRIAEEESAELIVLGFGHDPGLGRVLGKETALQVSHLSHLPVLAVPESGGRLPKKLVGAVDFSEFSRAAIRHAITICQPGAELHLAHVLPGKLKDLDGWMNDLLGTLRQEASKQLDEWARQFDGENGITVIPHNLEGSPGAELIGLAEAIGADLIAAGSHGTGFLGRVLMGSVSRRLLRSADCSVLVAPPVERATELEIAHP